LPQRFSWLRNMFRSYCCIFLSLLYLKYELFVLRTDVLILRCSDPCVLHEDCFSFTSLIATLLTRNHFYSLSGPIKRHMNVRPDPMPTFLLLHGNAVVRPHLCSHAVSISPICLRSPFMGTCERLAAYLVPHAAGTR